MPGIIQDLNWLDVFFIILLLGIIYKGLRTGAGNQVLSLAGCLFIIFISLSYYNHFAETIFGFLRSRWSKPVSFFTISAISFAGVKILDSIFRKEEIGDLSVIERIGGAVLAGFRGFMFLGIIGIFLVMVPVDPLKQSAPRDSRVCMYFVELDAWLYSSMTKFLGGSGGKQKEDVVKEIFDTAKKGGKENEA